MLCRRSASFTSMTRMSSTIANIILRKLSARLSSESRARNSDILVEIFVTRAFSGAAKAVLIAGYIISLTGRGSVPILAGVVCIAFGLVHMGGLKTRDVM